MDTRNVYPCSHKRGRLVELRDLGWRYRLVIVTTPASPPNPQLVGDSSV